MAAALVHQAAQQLDLPKRSRQARKGQQLQGEEHPGADHPRAEQVTDLLPQAATPEQPLDFR